MNYKVGDRVKVIVNGSELPHQIPVGTYGTIRMIYSMSDYPIQLREFTGCLAENEIRWALNGEENLAI